MADHLFVYGTLRAGCRHPMHDVLRRHAESVGRARFAGRLYHVGAYPAAVPAADASPPVTGELYRLRDPATLLPQLDRYEGCTDSPDAATEYRRERQPVIRADGSAVKAWIYLYNRPVGALRRIVSGDYLSDDPPHRAAHSRRG